MLCWETNDETILGSELLLPLGRLQLGSDRTGTHAVRTMVAASNCVFYFIIRYPTCLMTYRIHLFNIFVIKHFLNYYKIVVKSVESTFLNIYK